MTSRNGLPLAGSRDQHEQQCRGEYQSEAESHDVHNTADIGQYPP
jgi:hypothetical protein